MMSAQMEQEFELGKWANEIPYIKWPSDWEVKAVPPFTGAIIRYWIKTPRGRVSVYLDCYDLIGYFGEPYWEIYPNIDGDVDRVKMNDVEGLLQCISNAMKDEV